MDQPDPSAGQRSVALASLVLLVGLSMAGSGLAQPATDGATPLSSCTVVDDPGRYELTENLSTDADVCLYVRSDDVVVDGNGHSIDGDGTADGTGVLVFNGTDDRRRRGPELSNVTVRDVRVREWERGVSLGVFGHGGPEATLDTVTARGNRVGIRLVGADRSTLRDVRASGGADGFVLRESAGVRATDLTAATNDDAGLYLTDGVRNGTFRGVTARYNDGEGIALSMAVGNRLEDTRVMANGGPGVEFADSRRNVLANATVVGNRGPGVLSNPANGDRLSNVTVRDNAGGAYLSESAFGGVVADRVRLGPHATVDWTRGVEQIGLASPSLTPPANATVISDGVRIERHTGSSASVTVRLRYDPETVGEADGHVSLWQWDGGSWDRVPNATVDSGAVSGTTTGDGVVVVLLDTATSAAG